MIKLMDLVNESKNIGVLYHMCDYYNLIPILKSNSLKPSEFWHGCIAITRSLTSMFNKHSGPQYAIKLDGNKISNNYKIKPLYYSYLDNMVKHDPKNGNTLNLDMGDPDDEMEEIICGRELKNLNKYILEIYLQVDNIIKRRKIKFLNIKYELETIKQLYPNLKYLYNFKEISEDEALKILNNG